jgi:hypothetical protein
LAIASRAVLVESATRPRPLSCISSRLLTSLAWSIRPSMRVWVPRMAVSISAFLA